MPASKPASPSPTHRPRSRSTSGRGCRPSAPGSTAPPPPRRDLQHLVADLRFRPALTAAIPAYCASRGRNTSTLDDLLGFPAIEPLVRDWLMVQIEGIPAAGALHAGDAIERVASSVGPDTLIEIPGALDPRSSTRI